MNRRILTGVILVGAMALVGCKSTPHRTAAVPEGRDAEMLGGIAALAGTWEMADEEGQNMTATVYRPTAAGSAVEEVMFPGTPHEMVNLYHMDGNDLVVTHYCAAGNQPRMVSTGPETGADGSRVYRFRFDSVANLRPEHDHYMGNLTLAIKGDALTQTWVSLDGKGAKSEPVVFEMRRK